MQSRLSRYGSSSSPTSRLARSRCSCRVLQPHAVYRQQSAARRVWMAAEPDGAAQSSQVGWSSIMLRCVPQSATTLFLPCYMNRGSLSLMRIAEVSLQILIRFTDCRVSNRRSRSLKACCQRRTLRWARKALHGVLSCCSLCCKRRHAQETYQFSTTQLCVIGSSACTQPLK